jgi:3-phosphoshikimate 1-carboxyvinyltransferase
MTYQPPVASAQVKSAGLLAGLSAQGTTTVVEPVPTRDHTERLLRQFHAVVRQRGSAVSVEGGRSLESPGRLTIPGDFSSAAFFLVAAACLPGSVLEIQGLGLNPTRTAVLRVLERMGASVQAERLDDAWEPRGTVRVTAQPLRGTTVEPQEVPGMIDGLPLVMGAACCARGTTHLQGLAELRVKETDRIRSMTQGLARLGARVGFAGADSLRITGTSLHGATVESTGDHRTAMALAIAGLGLEEAVRRDPALALGVNVYAGQVTNPGVAKAHGLPAVALDTLIDGMS